MESKELWEWCGFRFQKIGELKKIYRHHANLRWVFPTGEIGALPELTLDNLFKYAIPKVTKEYDLRMWSYYDETNDKVFYFTALDKDGETEYASIVGQEKLEDAILIVLQEVMKGEKDGNML